MDETRSVMSWYPRNDDYWDIKEMEYWYCVNDEQLITWCSAV